jgi:ABC-2 type transport system permease protein
MLAEVGALVRARFLTMASYRLQMVLSVVALVVSVVPVFFIATALQPTMARSIAAEGGQYFGFLVVGMVALALVNACVSVLPGEVGSGITTGTLEALLATPTRVERLLLGLSGFGLLWILLRGALLLLAAWVLGAAVHWDRVLPALMVVALIVASHLPIGVLATAAVIAFRTTAGIPRAVLAGSVFLGGAYYPTGVIPSWLHHLSYAVPMSYGLRALRRVLLEGAPLSSAAGDLTALLGFAVALGLLAALALRASKRYARQGGTLAQY